MTTQALTDSEMIDRDIDIAARERREMSDGTARRIASMFHDGSTLTLSFASTGAIVADSGEVWFAFFPDYRNLPSQEKRWANWLGTYMINRADKGPQADWLNRP